MQNNEESGWNELLQYELECNGENWDDILFGNISPADLDNPGMMDDPILYSRRCVYIGIQPEGSSNLVVSAPRDPQWKSEGSPLIAW